MCNSLAARGPFLDRMIRAVPGAGLMGTHAYGPQWFATVARPQVRLLAERDGVVRGKDSQGAAHRDGGSCCVEHRIAAPRATRLSEPGQEVVATAGVGQRCGGAHRAAAPTQQVLNMSRFAPWVPQRPLA